MRVSLASLLTAFLLLGANAPVTRPDTMVPPSQRTALPAFTPLSGRFSSDAFTREQLTARVGVLNVWYEF